MVGYTLNFCPQILQGSNDITPQESSENNQVTGKDVIFHSSLINQAIKCSCHHQRKQTPHGHTSTQPHCVVPHFLRKRKRQHKATVSMQSVPQTSCSDTNSYFASLKLSDSFRIEHNYSIWTRSREDRFQVSVPDNYCTASAIRTASTETGDTAVIDVLSHICFTVETAELAGHGSEPAILNKVYNQTFHHNKKTTNSYDIPGLLEGDHTYFRRLDSNVIDYFTQRTDCLWCKDCADCEHNWLKNFDHSRSLRARNNLKSLEIIHLESESDPCDSSGSSSDESKHTEPQLKGKLLDDFM